LDEAIAKRVSSLRQKIEELTGAARIGGVTRCGHHGEKNEAD
jgi:hypothetical protein